MGGEVEAMFALLWWGGEVRPGVSNLIVNTVKQGRQSH